MRHSPLTAGHIRIGGIVTHNRISSPLRKQRNLNTTILHITAATIYCRQGSVFQYDFFTTSVPSLIMSTISPLHGGRQWPRPVRYVQLGLRQLASVTAVGVLLVSKERFSLSLWRHRPTNSVILTSKQGTGRCKRKGWSKTPKSSSVSKQLKRVDCIKLVWIRL